MLPEVLIVPFKGNAAQRHHTPGQRHQVTNLAPYDDAVRQRDSLTAWFTTAWFTDAALAACKAKPRVTRGGQSRHSAPANATARTLRAVFRLALRQTEDTVLRGKRGRVSILTGRRSGVEDQWVRGNLGLIEAMLSLYWTAHLSCTTRQSECHSRPNRAAT